MTVVKERAHVKKPEVPPGSIFDLIRDLNLNSTEKHFVVSEEDHRRVGLFIMGNENNPIFGYVTLMEHKPHRIVLHTKKDAIEFFKNIRIVQLKPHYNMCNIKE